MQKDVTFYLWDKNFVPISDFIANVIGGYSALCAGLTFPDPGPKFEPSGVGFRPGFLLGAPFLSDSLRVYWLDFTSKSGYNVVAL